MFAHGSADGLGALQDVARLSAGGVFAGIADVDGEVLEDGEGRPEGVEQRDHGQAKVQQKEEVVGLGESQPRLNEHGLEILFHALLRMEARGIVVRLPACAQFPARGVKVAFRLC